MRLRSGIGLSVHGLAALFLLALGACTKNLPAPSSPEGTLERYVKTAFGAKSVDAKKELLKLSSGDALVWLESLSDEEFRKQFVENQMQFISLKTRDKREDNNGDVSMVYELEFKDGRGPAPLDKSGAVTPSVAVYATKKIAYLVKDKESGEWRIKATKNVKSFIERKEDLVVPPLGVLPPDEGEAKGAAEKK